MVTFRLAPALLRAGRRVYAIGDVHGLAGRLLALHAAIAADLAARPCRAALVVHLGDYLDRGPASAAVLARLAAGDPVAGAETVNLRGNHEALALAVLNGGDEEAVALWRMNGAEPTLRSWGIDPASPHEGWAAQVPEAQLRFLRGLRVCHREDGYVFVHAGVRPGVALAAQDEEDFVWIREPFLSYRGDFDAVVVHGHTPGKEPVVRANRIGLDTGAVYGGRLTAGILEEDRLGFLQA
ncbi:MAG: metallophosphoesterase [Rhodospirillales bacterium]|nr:metallophosphoesterase [Rhodospirillales bacterium]